MKLSNPKTGKYEYKVQSGLSVTPAEMMNLSKQGIPVSAQQVSASYDGKTTYDYGVDAEYKRGVDINDLWNTKQSAKDKLRQLKSKINTKSE